MQLRGVGIIGESIFSIQSAGSYRSRMERPTNRKLRIGDWCVDPALGQISRNGETARVEERAMRLLLCLAGHAGEVVSIDELLGQVWSDVNVSPDSVYQAVTSLRRLLGDDPRHPAYIATVPRLGYRMVAQVGPWREGLSENLAEQSSLPQSATSHAKKAREMEHAEWFRGTGFRWAAAVVICLGGVGLVALQFRGKASNESSGSVVAAQSQKSIAVLPFLDLTQGMKEEEFADGMTEELIDKLSKISGIHVPAPTASFYFKGKQMPVAEIAKQLGVVYVLDGSVRKSGGRLRVAARLVRADSGFVIWTETYDRPFDDIIMVQDDIAGEVTKALKPSIDHGPDH
jgi:transcriptional activator of cad operon